MLSNAIPLALASACYPPGLAVIVLILGNPKGLTTGTVFLAGAVLSAFGLGLGAMLLLTGLNTSSPSNQSARGWIEIGLGVAAMGYAVWWLRRKPRDGRLHLPTLSADKRRALFVLGIVMFLPSFLFLGAVEIIGSGHYSLPEKIGSLVILVIIDLVVLWAPIVFFAVRPDWSRRQLGKLNDWLALNGRTLLVWLLAFTGLYLVYAGATKL